MDEHDSQEMGVSQAQAGEPWTEENDLGNRDGIEGPGPGTSSEG